jgi:leucine dehydrogenase
MVEVRQVNTKPFSLFNQLEQNGHQNVLFCSDTGTGLKAIIAIHDTTLGPAIGGTRMWTYGTEEEALEDVLRISRGMTYKASISGINCGGGSAVIIGDSRSEKSESLMRRFGKFINNLNGEFITGEDLGTTPRDMEFIRMETKHVVGIPEFLGGSGDTAPITAFGVYMAMKASAKELWGNDSLAGKSVVVQGVGHVGEALVKLLREDSAKVYISDLNDERLLAVSKKYAAKPMANNHIYDLDIDIYAPCAFGATLNTENINRLKCSIITGSANNQLENEEIHGKMLFDKGILYGPDFLINAGGLINAYSEIAGYNKKKAEQLTEKIYEVSRMIYKKSKTELIPTHQAALEIASQRISNIRKIKAFY